MLSKKFLSMSKPKVVNFGKICKLVRVTGDRVTGDRVAGDRDTGDRDTVEQEYRKKRKTERC
ncbi:MAG: hypothetical protein AAGK97_03975 [Bacteroidota bacterium]